MHNSSLFAIVAILSLSASSAVTVDRQTLLTSRRENRKQRRLNKKNSVIDTEDIEFFTQQRSLQSFNPTPRPPTPRPPTPRPPTPPNPPPTRRPTVSIIYCNGCYVCIAIHVSNARFYPLYETQKYYEHIICTITTIFTLQPRPQNPPPTPTPPTPPPPTPTPPTPTPPPPTPPTFNCPPASFVGCTAPDPTDFQDECPTIGQPCVNGNPGEFCCRDACPRNYCTAKQALPNFSTRGMKKAARKKMRNGGN